MTVISFISLLTMMALIGNTCYEVGKTVGRDKQRQQCDCCCGEECDADDKK